MGSPALPTKRLAPLSDCRKERKLEATPLDGIRSKVLEREHKWGHLPLANPCMWLPTYAKCFGTTLAQQLRRRQYVRYESELDECTAKHVWKWCHWQNILHVKTYLYFSDKKRQVFYQETYPFMYHSSWKLSAHQHSPTYGRGEEKHQCNVGQLSLRWDIWCSRNTRVVLIIIGQIGKTPLRRRFISMSFIYM